jgi:hypothetical protein
LAHPRGAWCQPRAGKSRHVSLYFTRMLLTKHIHPGNISEGLEN